MAIAEYDCGVNSKANWQPRERGDGFRITFTSADNARMTDIDFICDPNFEGSGYLLPVGTGTAIKAETRTKSNHSYRRAITE
jgi:hypothetical protein